MVNNTEDNLEMELVELWESAKRLNNPLDSFLNWEETRTIIPVLIEIWKNKHELMLEFNRIKRQWELTKKALERRDRQLEESKKQIEELQKYGVIQK